MSDLSVLQSILGSKTIAYHAIYARATGSVPAAVMISQALFWQESAKFKDLVDLGGEMYFAKTADEWSGETGVTEEQQKTARLLLSKLGIFKERRAGLPAKLHYRIELETLVAVIYRYLNTGKSEAVDNRSQKRELTRTSSGKFRQLEAVNSGNNIIESLESVESLKDSSSLSESENSDGVDLKTTLHDVVRVTPLEAKKEREEKPSPTVPGEIPKRDPNDPRPNLEIRMEKIKDLAGNYQEGNPSLERMRANYRLLKAEYNLEGNIDIVVARLNEKAKMPRGYNADKKETRTAIRKRLKEYTLEDLFTVVDFKCREWKDDPKLRQYLRPGTLFNGHFEDYLNAALQDKQSPIAEKNPYAPPAYRHEAPPASTAQAGYVD